MKYLSFCFFISAIFFVTLFSMKRKEDVLSTFKADLDLFIYAVNIIENKVPYKIDIKNTEFIEFLVKDKMFYKKDRENIADCAKRFKELRDGKVQAIALNKDKRDEILNISRKIQKRYNKWEELKKREEKEREKLETHKKLKIEKERMKIEIEFEKANMKFAEAKLKFAEAKKKYEQALNETKKEVNEIKRKEESKRIEAEFENANLEFAEAKTRFAGAEKEYIQALRNMKNKK